MQDLFRRRPVASFYVIALLIGILSQVLRAVHATPVAAMFQDMAAQHMHQNLITGFWVIPKYRGAYTFFLFPAAPMIAALIVTGLAYGRTGYAELFSRVLPWRAPVPWRQAVLVLLVCWLVFFAVAGMMWTATALYGPPNAFADTLARFGGTPAAINLILFASLLISTGPVLEELGWRGFVLPHLLRRFDPLTAAIVLGSLWWFWHFPRDVPTLLSGSPGAVMSIVTKQLVIIPGFIAGTIIAVFLCNKLGGSLWGGVMAHAIHNEWSGNVTIDWAPHVLGSAWRVTDVIEMIVALLLVIVFGRNLGADTPLNTRLAWGNQPPVLA